MDHDAQQAAKRQLRIDLLKIMAESTGFACTKDGRCLWIISQESLERIQGLAPEKAKGFASADQIRADYAAIGVDLGF